ncbi:MAG: ABC transporter ATP-binding protein [Actinomycetes bacterium]
MTTALQLRGVRKSFPGVRALDSVDLDVRAGELMAILGPSGCGKTTLLRAVAGFERIDAGRIALRGHAVALEGLHLPTHRREVGIVPQEGALFPHLSVAENVGFGLPRRSPARAARIEEFLELVGLGGYGRRMPHELSGGQQQRVALARALAPGPALVLLDEPFSALDAALRTELRADVRRVLHEQDMTALLVTHDQSEALSVADRIAVMSAGRVIQTAAPLDLYSHPADPWVATFLGEACWLPGVVVAGELRTRVGPLLVGAGVAEHARALVRPEQVVLAAGGAPATVTDVAFHGHDALLGLALDDGTHLQCRLAHTTTLPLEGERVGVQVTGTPLLVEQLA